MRSHLVLFAMLAGMLVNDCSAARSLSKRPSRPPPPINNERLDELIHRHVPGYGMDMNRARMHAAEEALDGRTPAVHTAYMQRLQNQFESGQAHKDLLDMEHYVWRYGTHSHPRHGEIRQSLNRVDHTSAQAMPPLLPEPHYPSAMLDRMHSTSKDNVHSYAQQMDHYNARREQTAKGKASGTSQHTI